MKKATALVVMLVLVLAGNVFSQKVEDLQVPKNIIIMISDGWGYNQIDATNYFTNGAKGVTSYENFPVKLDMSTYPAILTKYNEDAVYNYGYSPEEAWDDFEYIKSYYTDSAAAATAMSTGVKAYSGGIGKDINGNDLVHLADVAKQMGKSTGVVSSVEWSHATPAAFVAHNETRNDYEGIAQEMLLDSKIDVIMGAGNPDFDDDGQPSTTSSSKYVGGDEVWTQLQAGATTFTVNGVENTVEDCNGDNTPDAWTLIQDKADFEALMTGDTPGRVCGTPNVYKTLQYNRYTTQTGDHLPYADALNADVPSLETMTKGALNVLDNNSEGLFLMVEAGAVDWAGHGNSSSRVIEEMIDFNNSVDAVIAWVETNSNWEETLLIVTGDHETGMLWGPGAGGDNFAPVVNNGQGNLPGMEWYSGSHTNQLIPVYAKGQAAELLKLYADEEDVRKGRFLDNTEVAQACFDLWPKEQAPAAPKNIILLIADGWGENQILATDYWNHGAADQQAYSNFSVSSWMSTYPAILTKYDQDPVFNYGYSPKEAWDDFEYIKSYYTDSAAAATAMSTGVKAYSGSIGKDIHDNNLLHIIEYAETIGKSTGVVSSVEWSHATPAAFVAHNVTRNDYAGIAQEMLLDSKVDVIMGAGNPDYDDDGQPSTTSSSKYVGGDEVWTQLQAGATTFTVDGATNTVEDANGDSTPDAWTLIQDKADFEALAAGTGTIPARVCGTPKVYKTLQYNRSTSQTGEHNPYSDALNADVPSLETMTKGAINVLNTNTNGFFLMVEAGAVDWAGHGNSSSRVIEEMDDFNASVDAVIEWVNANSSWDETLVIVTGDHETGMLWGPNAGGREFPRVGNNGAGVLPSMEWYSGSHTNQLIPFYAEGAGASIYNIFAENEVDSVRGNFLNNTEIAQGFFKLWGGVEAAVPVELTSFSATVSGDNVVLAWETATELNNNGFEIERRTENSNWTNIGFVAGNGTTSEVNKYNFVDNAPVQGINLYRFKQIDFDGTYEYSNVVEVSTITPNKFDLSQNYPNPFNPSTTINFTIPVDSQVKLTVYNVLGQEVISLVNKELKAGNHNVKFNASELTSGMYIYKIEAGNYEAMKKMMLIK